MQETGCIQRFSEDSQAVPSLVFKKDIGNLEKDSRTIVLHGRQVYLKVVRSALQAYQLLKISNLFIRSIEGLHTQHERLGRRKPDFFEGGTRTVERFTLQANRRNGFVPISRHRAKHDALDLCGDGRASTASRGLLEKKLCPENTARAENLGLDQGRLLTVATPAAQEEYQKKTGFRSQSSHQTVH